jgi:uncharacterized FlaG/YvyC family protein
MKKQDIIRIINEEVDIALDEISDPNLQVYDSMLPPILLMISAGVVGVKKAIKYLKEKGLDKQEIIDVIKKAKSKLNESLEATNKKTGKDVTKHVNDYMAGNIDKKEFEKLTGLKKEPVNESEEVYVNVIDRETGKLITDTPLKKSLALKLAALKKGWITTKHPIIVVYNGKRLAVEPGDIERLKSGKDVVGNSTKYAGQEEWIPARGKWKIEESINENEGMTKSLKDIDPSLSLTKYDTTPPSFKITYRVKDDMSKEMEQELVAWVLSKGGRVDSVETMFDVEDGERYYYPYVKFSYK